VVSNDGAYAGVITLDTLDAATDRPDATAGELALLVTTLDPQRRLDTALDLLLRSDADGLPVLASNGEITGWVSHRDVLAAYQRLLSQEHPTGHSASPLGPAHAPAVATQST
jgi:CBS domain-containing protein